MVIRQAVRQNIGIPVCVGIADTKTLAKLANHCAKKRYAGHDGVCDFGRFNVEVKIKIFSKIPVGDVWGVGRKITEKLMSMNINTVEDLRTANPDNIRSQFSVVLWRTQQELNGMACIELEDAEISRQQIMVSRSFGMAVTAIEDLSESVAYFATTAAGKLRQDGSVASSISVFIRTSQFKDEEHYEQSLVVPLPDPTDDTTTLVKAALSGLMKIYRSGFSYKKSGVMLMDLQPKGSVQPTLFDDNDAQEKSDNLMHVMDAINQKMGKGSLTIAASGLIHGWSMRRENKSPNYTTEWDELPVVR